MSTSSLLIDSAIDDATFSPTPHSLSYSTVDNKGYYSLNAVFSRQSDLGLLEFLCSLQDRIREHARSIGVPLISSPHHGEGLYIYPANTIHCVILVDDPKPNAPLASIDKHDAMRHRWHEIDGSSVGKFLACPCWLYGGPLEPDTAFSTHSFTIQNYIMQSTVDSVQQAFSGVPKVYPTSSRRVARGATNLARFMSPAGHPMPKTLADNITLLFHDINESFSKPECYEIDVLSAVLSDAWMSNNDPVISDHRLS